MSHWVQDIAITPFLAIGGAIVSVTFARIGY